MTGGKSANQAQVLAAELPRLILAAERLAFAAAPGLHGRHAAGPGHAFWQFRDWQNGDDTRNIDWRRSAQGDRLYLKDREREASANIELCLVDSPTLDFASDKTLPTKRERASLLLLASAAILLRAGERVGLAGSPPQRAGPAALTAIAAGLISGVHAPNNPQARQIICGDFLQPDPEFTHRAGGVVLHILDPAECDFPYRGRVIFEGLGDASEIEAANAELWQTAYRSRIGALREHVAQSALAAGQTPVFHRTDMPPAHALAALYQALSGR